MVSFHFANFALSTTSSVDTTAEVGTAFYEEAEALLNWKASLDNQNKSLLSSWVGDRPCNNWDGITCDDLELGVTRLNLSNSGLKGMLYNLNFSSFPNLLTIDLSTNLLYGTIPDSIGDLSKLTHLDFSSNNLSGSLPLEMGNLGNLSYLILQNNKLSGSIPREIGKLGNLILLYLSNNNFSGSIPQEVEMMRSLTELDLGNNFLTGPIPASIGNLVLMFGPTNFRDLFLGKLE
nr:putative leucine-rich repeat receptor-like protein kinase [Quercus suber]